MEAGGGQGVGASAATLPSIPLAIRYVRGLLLFQAVNWGGWAVLLGVGVIASIVQVVSGSRGFDVIAFGVVAPSTALAGLTAVVTVRQRRRLAAGVGLARLQVAGLEVATTCLGVLAVLNAAGADEDTDGMPATMTALAGAVCAGSSALAVLALCTGAARRHPVRAG